MSSVKDLYIKGNLDVVGTADMNSSKILNLGNPTVPSDASNKSYVDAVAVGLSVKASCRLKTVGAVDAYTYNNDFIDIPE